MRVSAEIVSQNALISLSAWSESIREPKTQAESNGEIILFARKTSKIVSEGFTGIVRLWQNAIYNAEFSPFNIQEFSSRLEDKAELSIADRDTPIGMGRVFGRQIIIANILRHEPLSVGSVLPFVSGAVVHLGKLAFYCADTQGSACT